MGMQAHKYVGAHVGGHRRKRVPAYVVSEGTTLRRNNHVRAYGRACVCTSVYARVHTYAGAWCASP